MNKLLISKNGRNHIRVMPMKDCMVIPKDEKEKIEFCEKVFNDLQNSDAAVRHSYYCNRKRGILTGVWELDNKIYLNYCFRTADKGIYIDTLYVFPKDYRNDALAIEKFFRQNIHSIGEDYRKQIEEGKEEWLKMHDTRNVISKPN
jgi:hypothetical protein